MLLENYYTKKNSKILISKQQASDFAKQIAGDFNPIHDPDNAHFCVPGDLLFALILARYGLSQKMSFHFSGMVKDKVPLHFPNNDNQSFSITDDDEKEYLHVEHQGDISNEADLISQFTQNYVAFSGENFPGLIVPLMTKHKVMINPARPLVIYESMSFDLETIEFIEPSLELTDASLSIQGKKALCQLDFLVKSAETIIGRGNKKLALRGLIPFDQDRVEEMVETYNSRKINL